MGPASSFIVFADESGDHGLTRINANYPIFVLSCCIFRKDDYIDRVCPALQRFKLRWWPHDAIVLHSAQIKRQEPPYAFLQHLDRREEFMLDLTNTLHEMPFVLISGAIHKERLKQRYAVPGNPYAVALKFCMKRVHSYLCDQGEVESELHFLVERRGNVEDAELRERWLGFFGHEDRWTDCCTFPLWEEQIRCEDRDETMPPRSRPG